MMLFRVTIQQMRLLLVSHNTDLHYAVHACTTYTHNIHNLLKLLAQEITVSLSLGTKCMTVDVWKRSPKCTVIRASHDETCSFGGNGNCSYVDSVYTATCYCMWYIRVVT